MNRIILYITLFVCSYSSYGQGIVRFKSMTIDEALALAKKENKYVFVDSYAPWCVPCKQMDKEFRDREVAEYYNEHFINIKMNMDSHSSKKYAARYGIAFLPTIMYLESNGRSRLKIDNRVSKHELMAYAKHIVEGPTKAVVRTTTPVRRTTTKTETTAVTKKTTETPSNPPVSNNNTDDEKIVYVLDDAKSVPPEVLYQEAYLSMELMDGTHWKIASQYLDTQTDWSTPKNIRFINDFVRNTNSKEFDFMIANRDLFNQTIGKEQVDRTIEILVYNQINRGYPRPSLEEATKLYSYTNSSNPEAHAYRYTIRNMVNQKASKTETLKLLNTYIEKFGKTNDKILHLQALYTYTSGRTRNSEYQIALENVNKAIELHQEDGQYYFTKALICESLNKKKSAMEAIKQAMDLTDSSDAAYSQMLELRNRLF